jgi:hypothetical protein
MTISGTFTGTFVGTFTPSKPGLYVSGTKVLNPDGTEFRIRGVDRCHYDSPSFPGIVKSGANAVRLFITTGYGWTVPQLAAVCSEHVSNDQIIIPVLNLVPPGTTSTSGDVAPADLATCAAWWVTNASTFAPILNKTGILNIANEWGPANSSAWAQAYVTAIPTLRAAGYTCPIMVDCGGSGQDEYSISNYAKTVLAADTNVIFAYHLYGGTTLYEAPIASISGQVITLNSTAAIHPFTPSYTGTGNSWTPVSQLVVGGVTFPISQNVGGKSGSWTVTATGPIPSTAVPGAVLYDWANVSVRLPRLASYGVCVAVMEFGPGNNIGPSPTLVTPTQVIDGCESVSLGWCGWAWDDNNLAGGASNNAWFSMTLAGPGTYNVTADLTNYGQIVVPFLQSLAKPSTVF